VNSYERLDAWQAAHRLVLLIYRTTQSFPPEERFGLSSQLRRAAFAVAANMVEGAAKKGPREFRRYLDIAVGSIAELTYTLRLVRDLQLISEAQWQALEAQRDQVGRLTWGLYASMRRAIARRE
jgi:four helix bundle protein